MTPCSGSETPELQKLRISHRGARRWRNNHLARAEIWCECPQTTRQGGPQILAILPGTPAFLVPVDMPRHRRRIRAARALRGRAAARGRGSSGWRISHGSALRRRAVEAEPVQRLQLLDLRRAPAPEVIYTRLRVIRGKREMTMTLPPAQTPSLRCRLSGEPAIVYACGVSVQTPPRHMGRDLPLPKSSKSTILASKPRASGECRLKSIPDARPARRV